MRASKKSCRAKWTTSPLGGWSGRCAASRTRARAPLMLEGLRELIALGLHTGLLSSLVTLRRAAPLGLLFPLLPAVFHCGKLAHDGSLRGSSDGPRPWKGAAWTAEEP